MFFGRFAHTVDEKGRLTIPSKYRDALATGVVVTRGIDRCLYVYPLSEWRHISERIKQFSMMKKDARSFVRFLFAEATDCIPDKQGRVLIPTYLRDYANLSDHVIVAGSNNRLELWDPAAYEDENARLQQDVEGLAEQLSDLGIL
jgi:MraZ protein